MTIIRINIAAVFFIACVFMTGCKPANPRISDNNIKFDSIQVNRTCDSLHAPAGSCAEISIKYVYPKSGLEPECLALTQQLFARHFFGESNESAEPQKEVNRMADYIAADLSKIYAEYREEIERINGQDEDSIDVEELLGSVDGYYEHKYNSILFNSNNILSYSVCDESYSGGVHGARYYHCYNIDLASSRILTGEDIFYEGTGKELASIIVKKLAADNGLKSVSELEDIGFFSIDEIRPNPNFAIGSDGITYFFNEYEIGAYSLGLIAVHLPYGSIKHLISVDSPIYTLL